MIGTAVIGAATPVAIPGLVLLGIGALGLAKLLAHREEAPSKLVYDLDKAIEDAINRYIDRSQNNGHSPSTSMYGTGGEISLDFEAMFAMYEQYGERGLYAYLVDKNIVKDKYHGDFIIQDIFLPERQRRIDESMLVTQ